MLRKFRKTLLHWKNNPLRTPLIVRGARQVGKTYVVEAFGEEFFKKTVTVNFESEPIFQTCFETMDPKVILDKLSLILKERIILEETLIFFDEIQQCPKALQALRYFKEKMPEAYVIAAGSLLEFAIRDEDFSFPVGRIQFARLYPFSFEEFLLATGDQLLVQKLETYNIDTPPDEVLHEHLLKRVRTFFTIGGMPASILTFINTQSTLETRYVQQSLWNAFESDFSKYASKAQHRYLKRIFEEIPHLVGEQIKYSRIDPDLPNPARAIKHAIEQLRLAGLLHPIFATSAGGLPLSSGMKDNIFKLLFLDIGMLEQAMNVDSDHPNLMTGALAEQYVGQESLANADPFLDTRLFFWRREQGSAEVDYLYSHRGQIFPVEVKAGKTGKLKSLYVFMEEKKSSFGIKISQDRLSWDRGILSIPFYMLAHLERLVNEQLLVM